ncbi:hypothetical protein SCLCIDRAFT_109344, partial [Scleroderma citrinum Foug A]
QCMYNSFVYDIPLPSASGQLYLVTVGCQVGITAGWPATSPYVIGVSCTTYCKVNSLDEGVAAMVCAIDKKLARWVL